jgi:hypothetical protein
LRSRLSRHLGSVLAEPGPAQRLLLATVPPEGEPDAPELPPELNWHDYLAMLLHTAAEIEHSLMVQYLFTAYTLGGPQVPEGRREEVRAWQETILGIAKEEMGHLVTVQNLLTALGAPLNLNREEFPWGSRFYPFDFALRPFSRGTIAAYICAESAPGWSGPQADAIKEVAKVDTGRPVNSVGILYHRLLTIIDSKERIPDDLFRDDSVPFQASWDEWGRGYRKGTLGAEESNVAGVQSAELLILRVWSRMTAHNAIWEVGEQGEATGALTDPKGALSDSEDAGEQSHFTRFLAIFEALSKLDESERKLVARPVARNPTTATADAQEAAEAGVNPILDDGALLWGHLFNTRYRMLLLNLSHAFELADAPAADGAVTPRGALINRTFSEMYTLRAIAGMLVKLPLAPGSELNAGPPFQMPYTLVLPRRERDRWALHIDLIEASALLIDALREHASEQGRTYLTALRETDSMAREQIDRMLGIRRAGHATIGSGG